MELPASIRACLPKVALPGNLILEITESAVMANPSDGLSILTNLDRMGVTLAIDDFGTGYSSLAYLKRLPVDELKIDKSFVMDMEENENDAVIVRSTSTSRTTWAQVTPKGWNPGAWTSSRYSLRLLAGLLHGRPMNAEKLELWLRESGWSDQERRALRLEGAPKRCAGTQTLRNNQDGLQPCIDPLVLTHSGGPASRPPDEFVSAKPTLQIGGEVFADSLCSTHIDGRLEIAQLAAAS